MYYPCSVILEPSFEMEFPEDRYYRINRILLSAIGLWPYDNSKSRRFRFIFSLLIMVSLLTTQWIKLYTSKFSSDIVLKILSYNIILIICFVKYITFYAVFDNIKEFQGRVRYNWDILKDKQEIEIISKHGSYGKLFTIFLTMSAYTFCIFHMFTQYLAVFLNIIIPLNVSRPRKLMILTEYFIDPEKYFYIISIYLTIALTLSIVVWATESFSLTNALHAFGLFKIASYRIKNILSGINPHMCLTKRYTISHDRIIAAVDFHRRAIEFSDLLEASFGRVYLAILVIGVCSASINLCYLFRIITTEKEILEIIKSILLIMIHIIYVTLANFAGQEFINYDTEFYCMVCSTKWYNAPIKTQKLILFLMQKTTKCYKVDAGGMFSPCLEGLARLMKLITMKYDVDLILRVLSSALPFTLFTVKYVTFYFVTKKVKELMQHIQNDWNTLKDNNELEIIHRYAKVAKLFTTSLATLIYVCIFAVICNQHVPSFLDIIAPLNNSRQTELLFQVEYFLDQDRYYQTIQFHMDIGLIVAAMTILSTETFCLILAIHAFGLFKITSYRMECIINKSAPNTFMEKHCAFQNNVVTAVNCHRRAIEFSENVKSTFAIPYLALILLGVSSSSINLYLLFQVIMSTSTTDDLIRSIIYVFCHFVYMFSTNYAGQKFIDHDAEVYNKICNIQWYNTPLRTQKQILFIMQKTIKSYHVDVGGLYSPSLQGFTALASASLSYFTVLCSVQNNNLS
ncbi:uncharacterized protein LOC113003323 isoform X3 [Solenopsis invicta]|uniref:uncharacterized protein LOC113003323 isoform X3 n=1 Tax=Solenopsis invicta TaxID=13686 RepID=UPI00193C9062|nr:uncharacterized protein LOC113003323 isoform X3 [Solenopsis invicta]